MTNAANNSQRESNPLAEAVSAARSGRTVEAMKAAALVDAATDLNVALVTVRRESVSPITPGDVAVYEAEKSRIWFESVSFRPYVINGKTKMVPHVNIALLDMLVHESTRPGGALSGVVCWDEVSIVPRPEPPADILTSAVVGSFRPYLGPQSLI